MVITLACVAIVAGCALSIGLRRGPILLRGRTVLWLTALAFVLQVAFRPAPAIIWVSLFAVLLPMSWLVRNTWIIFKESQARLALAVEGRLRRVLVGFTGGPDRYRLDLVNLPFLQTHRPLPGLFTLTFGGDWNNNRAKVTLRFLAKYFEPVIPRVRFRV